MACPKLYRRVRQYRVLRREGCVPGGAPEWRQLHFHLARRLSLAPSPAPPPAQALNARCARMRAALRGPDSARASPHLLEPLLAEVEVHGHEDDHQGVEGLRVGEGHGQDLRHR
jgi:hypothetical protein